MQHGKKFYALFKLVGMALGSALALPAFLQTWIWLVAPVAALLVLMFVIKTPATKALIVGAALVLGAYSYVLGRLYYNGRGLDSPSSILLMSASMFVLFLAVYVGVTESRTDTTA